MKKIALVIDSKDWAFNFIAEQLKKNIKQYECDIIVGEEYHGNYAKLFEDLNGYDLIHFMWRGYLSALETRENWAYIESKGYTDLEAFFRDYFYTKRKSFAVCDELYLSGDDAWRTEKILYYCKNYFVTSKRLFDIYSNFDKKPKKIIHDGVDLEKYKPENLDRFKNKETITIGWAGNSEFKDSNGDDDLKGVKRIIKPAIEELQQEGYKIELKMADSKHNKIPKEEMPNFYNSIDIYVCASSSEGTPLTVLESMAMGLPVISTDVGVVSEAFGKKQHEYILKNRTKEDLKEKIIELYNDRNKMKELSEENLESIKKWDWKEISKEYYKFFRKIIWSRNK